MPALYPQLIPALEIKEFSATGIVICFQNLRALPPESSFQILIKEKLKIADIPGKARGTI